MPLDIQEVTPTDHRAATAILARFRHDDTYVLSPAYLLMTGRRGLWRATDAENVVFFCRHPNVDDTLLVFPPFGPDARALLGEVLRQIRAWAPVIRLARISPAADRRMRGFGRRVDEDFLDWAWPCRALSVSHTGAARGKRFTRVRREINRARRAGLLMRPLDPRSDFDSFPRIVDGWAQDRDESGPAHLVTPADALLGAWHRLAMDGYVLEAPDGSLAGFMVWERTRRTSGLACAYLSHVLPGVTGGPETLMVGACRLLARQGYRELYLGGSETAKLDEYKRKYHPTRDVRLHSAVVD